MCGTTPVGQIRDDKIYVVQTNPKVIERCLLMTTDPGDLVLDPTCGSGTTAYVAEQWGRRWITCDTSRVALALARTRLMAAKYPYYLLADSPRRQSRKKTETAPARCRRRYKTESGHQQGLRLQARAARHAQVDRQQPGHQRRHDARSREIDAAIARHAETETLFDQPYEDNKRVRVSGPFTVESLRRTARSASRRRSSGRKSGRTA